MAKDINENIIELQETITRQEDEIYDLREKIDELYLEIGELEDRLDQCEDSDE